MKYSIVNDKNSSKKNQQQSVENPSWALDEIVLPDDTLEQLEEMIAYIHNRGVLLDQWEFRRFLKFGTGCTANFFGSPGTGKSITAEAIANKLKMKIIKVSYSELESEYVGQTSKNLSDVFQTAEETNSLLFFDEADAILSRRISNLSHAADHGVNMTKSTLLTLLDRFDGVVIFATNLFENYDEAFLRRIIFNVEFPIPNAEMRTRLWKFHLSENIPKTISYEKLAELSEGLSGGEIRNVTLKLCLKLITRKFDKINDFLAQLEIERFKLVRHQHSQLSYIEASREDQTEEVN